MNTAGERLEYIRKMILNINQTQLADLLGVTQTTISVAERSGNVSTKLSHALCSHVDGLNINWLKTGKGEVFSPNSKFKEFESRIQKIQQQNINSINSSNTISTGDIRGEQNQELLKVKMELDYKNSLIEELHKRIESQEKQTEAKDKHISSLEDQIKLLTRLLEKG